MFGLPRITGFERKLWDDNYATLLIGPKRVGKSTALAMIARQGIAAGYTVYSNYPIDGTIKVPKVVTKDGKTVTDKTFLYDNPLLQKSIILLDEVSNIWNNRSWGKWTEDDSDFFNYLGKNDTRVFMAVQYYDMVDLNVKRNTDATWFFTRSLWPNTTIVECDIQRVCKVENILPRCSHFRVDGDFQHIIIGRGLYHGADLQIGGLVNVSGNPVQLQKCFHDVQKISLPYRAFASSSMVCRSFSHV